MLRILSRKDRKQVKQVKQVLLEEVIDQFKEDTCRICEEITRLEYTGSKIEKQPFWEIKRYLVDYYNCITCGKEKRYYTGLK